MKSYNDLKVGTLIIFKKTFEVPKVKIEPGTVGIVTCCLVGDDKRKLLKETEEYYPDGLIGFIPILDSSTVQIAQNFEDFFDNIETLSTFEEFEKFKDLFEHSNIQFFEIWEKCETEKKNFEKMIKKSRNVTKERLKDYEIYKDFYLKETHGYYIKDGSFVISFK